MSYIKSTWQDGDVITTEKLNNIESGIESSLSNELLALYKTMAGKDWPYDPNPTDAEIIDKIAADASGSDGGGNTIASPIVEIELEVSNNATPSDPLPVKDYTISDISDLKSNNIPVLVYVNVEPYGKIYLLPVYSMGIIERNRTSDGFVGVIHNTIWDVSSSMPKSQDTIFVFRDEGSGLYFQITN